MCDFCQYDHKTEEHDKLFKGVIPQLMGKPQYKDAPRLPMIYDYEGQFKENYGKQVDVMSKELTKKLLSFI